MAEPTTVTGMGSIGITLGYAKTGSTYTDMPGLQEVPELGGDPEKIDVTTLADTVKRSVPGVKDLGDLQFKFLYDAGTFKAAKDLEGATIKFQVAFPDGVKFNFDAIPNVKMGGAAVNGALTFSIGMSLQSEITPTFPGVGA